MAFPALYMTGQRNDDLNVYRFCLWIGNAIFHACVSFWLPIYIVAGYPTEAFHLQGTTIYTGLLMTMNCKVIMETMSWTMYSHGFIVFSLLLFFFFLGVYPLFTFLSWDMVGITPVLLSGIYWAVFFLVPVANFLVDLSLKLYDHPPLFLMATKQQRSFGNVAWMKFYCPTDADILRERYVLKRLRAKVSCGVSEAAKTQGMHEPVDDRRGSVGRTPDQLIADKKAGVRNLTDVMYTGFAYTSAESVGRGLGARDIASLRVDQFQQTGKTDVITEMRLHSAGHFVPPPGVIADESDGE
ncbi:hypothetical protein DYB37_012825 [Aphanomyces astaci]|uniref:P-type ATPase C-terminal domain-containing protein n=3 Tax=Aphanomyces astaci TaxID=112090 RepID=A0A418FNQ8_APHAT|nr:hypothetical protein DYB37_012825 [Aphanomyces astaci]